MVKSCFFKGKIFIFCTSTRQRPATKLLILSPLVPFSFLFSWDALKSLGQEDPWQRWRYVRCGFKSSFQGNIWQAVLEELHHLLSAGFFSTPQMEWLGE